MNDRFSGETVRGFCAINTTYIFSLQVDPSYVSEPAGGGVISEGGGLFTATKRLHLVLRRKHFQHSRQVNVPYINTKLTSKSKSQLLIIEYKRIAP